jgi:alpha-amylase
MHALGDGWYVYRIEGVDTASLVFHDEHGRQTADLRRGPDGWMDRDGRWQDADPRTAGTAAASGTTPGSTETTWTTRWRRSGTGKGTSATRRAANP